jgi:hypothetical protein
MQINTKTIRFLPRGQPGYFFQENKTNRVFAIVNRNIFYEKQLKIRKRLTCSQKLVHYQVSWLLLDDKQLASF